MATASYRAGALMEPSRQRASEVAGHWWRRALVALGVGWYAYHAFRRPHAADDGYSPRRYEEGEEVPVRTRQAIG
jgi:hypothetical protein